MTNQDNLPMSGWLQHLAQFEVEDVQEYYDTAVHPEARSRPTSTSQKLSSREQLAAVGFLAKRDGWLCHYCGINLIPYDRENEFCYERDGEWITVDGYAFPHLEHKTPRCRGGGNEIENLTLSCPRCNSRKGKKTEAEFMEYLAR